MGVARIINEHDEAELLKPELMDVMPNHLTDRVFGRLISRCSIDGLGLISAYVWSHMFGSASRKEHTIVLPNGRPALLNPLVSISTMERVAAYYEENARWFLDTPRHDPARWKE